MQHASLRITLVISSMDPGGAQRVLSIMANYWQANGWQVTLITLDGKTTSFYALHPAVRHVPLNIIGETTNLSQKFWNMLKRIYAVRRALVDAKPDVVISFIDVTNIRVLLSAIGLKTPVIVSERIDPHLYQIGERWNKLRLLTYPRAAAIVAQSENARSYFPPHIQAKIRCIPNPVRLPSGVLPQVRKAADAPTIFALGRCVPQKGFDLLLEAFAQIAQDYPQWRVVIIGDGEQRSTLEALAHQLGIHQQIQFTGVVHNPFALLVTGDLFVLSSRFEGFPNALCEAMACGLPAISFDCPSGPREIIRDGVDGLLVPPEDSAALAVAMARLMQDGTLRRQLAERATEVVERFSLEKVMAMWADVISQARKG